MSLIVTAVLGFTALIVVHELGHYIVARACRMRVLKFSVGFGPPLVSWERSGVKWQIALVPVGGYVQVAGLGSQVEADGPGSFTSRPLWQRAAMIFAGPAANYLLATLIYFYLIASFNLLATPTNVLREVRGPAEAAGLLAHDTIVAIDGEEVDSFQDIRRATGRSAGEVMRITVIRPPVGHRPALKLAPVSEAGRGTRTYIPTPDPSWPRHTLEVTPEKKTKGYVIGVGPDMARFGTESWIRALEFAVAEPWHITQMMAAGLWRIAEGKDEAQLASVVKITQIGADTLELGFSDWFLKFLALLSVNLFLLNLLPVPALDGGRLIFIGIEAVARRPIPPRLENAIHGMGMIVLLGLILWVTVGDIASSF